MAISTIKGPASVTGTPTFVNGSKVSVQSCTCAYNATGAASLTVLFHITEAVSNGETLFTIGNIRDPIQNIVTVCISASNPSNYGNINFASNGVATAGGALNASDWYSLYVVYLY